MGADAARVALAGAFASHGEPVTRIRSKARKVARMRLAGMTLLAEAALAKKLGGRLGSSAP